MEIVMNGFAFKMMSFMFIFRDFFKPPSRILQEAYVEEGHQILDFGCGPGSYAIEAARITGKKGKVYAFDMNPLALQCVENKASKKALFNIITIRSDCKTGLHDESIDRVLLYDIFHILTEPERIIKELYRVMKHNAVLSFSDHHMTNSEIIENRVLMKYFEPVRFCDSTIIFKKRVFLN
jgi:ubiquinone/menaquinone biosynthesis C-methylase UbiE